MRKALVALFAAAPLTLSAAAFAADTAPSTSTASEGHKAKIHKVAKSEATPDSTKTAIAAETSAKAEPSTAPAKAEPSAAPAKAETGKATAKTPAKADHAKALKAEPSKEPAKAEPAKAAPSKVESKTEPTSKQ